MTDDDDVLPCDVCHGTGWTLTGDHDRRPLVLDLTPCPGPYCPGSGQPLEVLAVHGRFQRAVIHPGTRAVMSLTTARPPLVDTPATTTAQPGPTRVPPHSHLPPGARPTGPTGR